MVHWTKATGFFLFVIVFLALLSRTSCHAAAQDKPPEKPDWERMKECAAQAEKIMARPDMRGQDLIQSHYSPKYGRCFLITLYRSDKDGGYIDRQMIDAFEFLVLADDITLFRQGDDRQESCLLAAGGDLESRPCGEVQAYIQDHMSH